MQQTSPRLPSAIQVVAVMAGAVVMTRLHGRVEGWRLAVVCLAAFVLYSIAR